MNMLKSWVSVAELTVENNDSDLQVISYGDIRAATNDFSTQNSLGQGGFGPVYKVKHVILFSFFFFFFYFYYFC